MYKIQRVWQGQWVESMPIGNNRESADIEQSTGTDRSSSIAHFVKTDTGKIKMFTNHSSTEHSLRRCTLIMKDPFVNSN